MRADTDSLHSVPPNSPISIAENGFESHTSLPSISSPRSPIVDRSGRRMRRNNDYCLQQLLKSSSESTVDELPIIPPEFINGCVSEDSKFKYIVSENECEDRASDIEQLPTNSRTNMMISELCEYIRPNIVK